MFGYVAGNLQVMDPRDKDRYQAAYCGLCRQIGQSRGQIARLSLTYDLVFLILLLSSLYEPQERSGRSRCAVHPARRRAYFVNRFTDYAADMNVYLAYYKCLDDWRDQRKGTSRALAAALRGPCDAIGKRWPRQCDNVRAQLRALCAIEADAASLPDAAVNCFGALMGELFAFDEGDHFAPTLRRLGAGLGRFVYLMDAALDYGKDLKSGSYNPLKKMGRDPADLRETLTLLIGEAAVAFETLPLEQDLMLLRNILYGGVWQAYDRAFKKTPEEGVDRP